MTAPQAPPVPPSPEATGGKGTVLEHRFGGRLLAALLLGAPVEGLGGGLVPERVQFQGPEAVDDVVITAEGAGEAVTWYVASRMRPTLTARTDKTVALFADYLAVLRDRTADVDSGRVLLGLVTIAGFGPADRLGLLTGIAAGDTAAFRAAVARRNRELRDLLTQLDAIVAAAAAKLGWTTADRTARDWTHTLLRALRVVPRTFEPAGADAVATTTWLLPLVDGDAERADALRQHLDALAADYAAAGATVGDTEVRTALRGRVRIGSAAGLAEAFAAMTEAETALRRRTGRALQAGGVEHQVDRPAARAALLEAARATGQRAGVLVIRGEPSVGKSALTLEIVHALRAEEAAVVVCSVRAPVELGVPLSRVFGGFPVGPARLLVLDGAEVVQEGARERLADLAAAAHDAGIGVLAVTRDDAADRVREVLTAACGDGICEHVVEPLPDDDVASLIERFPALARLADRRSRWLLRRLGLVDLLLRAGPAASLRGGTLSEADVFVACWHGWVRAREQSRPGGPTPDARERALLDVARAVLHGQPARPEQDIALPGLRSDGLLLPYDALRAGEAFPNDIVRDLATVKHLLVDGGDDLAAAAAPRWALRAARIACQGRLATIGLPELRRQLVVFDRLAQTYGGRWADVPWEAVLNSGTAASLLEDAADFLLADDGDRLDDLLQAVEQHLQTFAAIDPVLGEPVIAWLTAPTRTAPSSLQARVDALVVRWLRGVRRDAAADGDAITRAVRQQVRAAVLARRPDAHDEELLRALATLGSDLDDDVRAVLRQIAAARPGFLEPVVEDLDAAEALADADPDLLAALATAYYVERPRRAGLFGGSGVLDDGVRDHRGLRRPWSHYAYGAFWPLLCRRPQLGRDLAVAVVGHAARFRVARGAPGGGSAGVHADVLGLGLREYAGDDHVYAWYRGSTVGPSVCTSALLACERAMDQLVAQGFAAREVARFFLAPSHDLAVLGLVVGFLVRHLDTVTDELDDLLAVPELWELEVARLIHEQGFVRAVDGDDVHGRDRRGLTFREIAAMLVARARGDATRTAQLRAVGERLREAAAAGAPHDAAGELLRVRTSAALLDADNYESGGGWLRFREPPELTAAHEAGREHLRDTATATRLLNTYTLRVTPPWFCGLPDVDHDLIPADVAAARELAGSPVGQEPIIGLSVLAATAAAAVRAAAAGCDLDLDDLVWACTEVVHAAQQPEPEPHDHGGAMYSAGVDRSAASALPSLLALLVEHAEADDEDRQHVADALAECTTATAHEVRRVAAIALRELWAQPCDPTERCRHRWAWSAVDAGARAVAFTPRDALGARGYAVLSGDLPAALHARPDDELVQQRVGIALANVCFALAAGRCVADDAARLLDALLPAYGRASLNYADEGYDVRREEHAAVGAALLAASTVQPDLLVRAVAATGGRSLPTAELLEGVMTAATYDAGLRSQLRLVWPNLLAALLDGPATPSWHSWRGRVIAVLLPAPQPSMHDEEYDASLRTARADWITAGELAGLVERWLPLAAKHREALDQLVLLLLASPADEQVRLGLPWVRRLVEPGGTAGVLSRIAVSWLERLSGSALPSAARADYHVILDALAGRGIDIAQELQRREG